MNSNEKTTASQIFVNLPVSDLPRSIEFFRGLGFDFNPQFTDETGTCMVIGENIFAMLLTHEKFLNFTPVPVGNAHEASEVIVCLSLPSRAKVDELITKAISSGGSACRPPEDHGWMYNHGFRDPDGHIWELMYADMALLEAQRGA